MADGPGGGGGGNDSQVRKLVMPSHVMSGPIMPGGMAVPQPMAEQCCQPYSLASGDGTPDPNQSPAAPYPGRSTVSPNMSTLPMGGAAPPNIALASGQGVMILPHGGFNPPNLPAIPHSPSFMVPQGNSNGYPNFFGFSPDSIKEGRRMNRLFQLEHYNDEIVNEMKAMVEEIRMKDKEHREEMQKIMNDLLDKEKKIMQLEIEKIQWQKERENLELKLEINKLKNGKAPNDIEETVKEVIRKEWPKTASNEQGTKEIGQEVKRLINNEFETWKAKNEQDKADFRKIIAEERVSQKKSFKQDVVNVLRSNGSVVRDMAEQKKCVVMFGVKEEKNPDKVIRERYEINKIRSILSGLGEDWVQDEVEEIVRLGRYIEGRSRPMKVRLYSQAAAEEILRNSWKLKELEPYKKVFIRRNMTEEERDKLNELITTVRQKNEERTDEERNQFFWRIKNEIILKCWIQETGRDH